MGGQWAGEVASQIAVEEIPQAYAEARRSASVEEALQIAVGRAHAAIRGYASTRGRQLAMGTTAVVAVVTDGRVVVANVGDSRAYLVRGGEIRQLTKDHSRAAVLAQAGAPSGEIARHVLIRSLSSSRERVEADIFAELLLSGDVLVLCSDGLWASVSEPSIARTVQELSPQAAAEALVKMANRAGGHDNVSVVVLRRGPAPEPAADDTGELRLEPEAGKAKGPRR
jgi:protein phosphatase